MVPSFLFILASSVCKSLQCLISTLTQGSEGGHLFRLTCSVVLGEGRGVWETLQTSITGVCGECSQCLGHNWVGPCSRCVWPFLVYTAQTPGCSARELSKVGPGLCAPPKSTLLRFRFSGTPQWCRLSWVCILCPSQVRAARVTRCLTSTVSQVCGASYHLPGPGCSVSWVRRKSMVLGMPSVSSGELISDWGPPGGCQPSRIPGRLG